MRDKTRNFLKIEIKKWENEGDGNCQTALFTQRFCEMFISVNLHSYVCLNGDTKCISYCG